AWRSEARRIPSSRSRTLPAEQLRRGAGRRPGRRAGRGHLPERLSGPGALFSASDLVAVVMAMNLAIALVRTRAGQPWNLQWQDALAIGGASGALVQAMSAIHQVVRGADLSLGFFLKSIADLLAGAALGAITAPPVSYLGFWLQPRLRGLGALLPYLREIWV